MYLGRMKYIVKKNNRTERWACPTNLQYKTKLVSPKKNTELALLAENLDKDQFLEGKKLLTNIFLEIGLRSIELWRPFLC
jgi:hypothetical protein